MSAAAPGIRVVRGQPEPDELAAVVAVLLARGAAAGAPAGGLGVGPPAASPAWVRGVEPVPAAGAWGRRPRPVWR